MKLLKKIVSFFKSEKEETITNTVDNTEIPKEALSQTQLILNKMINNESLPITEINLVLSDVFDIKSVQGSMHKLNGTLIEQAVFMIDTVSLITDNDKNPRCINFILKEDLFNIKMTVTIDATNFHEVFLPVTFTATT